VKLVKAFDYKGVSVQFYESTQYIRLVGGVQSVKNYHVFVDGQDVSRQVLTIDPTMEEWEKNAKRLIDQFTP